MNISELQQLLETTPDARLIDVRTPGEFQGGHLAGSYNVPLHTLGEHSAEIARATTPVVLICRSGQRARNAEQQLRKAGLQRVHVLEGGVLSWKAQGGSLIRRAPEKLPLERQVRLLAGLICAVGGLLSLTVAREFAWLPLVMGSGLVFAALTDWCGMALLLARLPYNQTGNCEPDKLVEALGAK